MTKKKYKSRLRTRIIFVVIVIIGLVLLNYPYLSGLVNTTFAYYDERQYVAEIDNSSEEALNKKIADAHAYNEALFAGMKMDEYEDFDMTREGYFFGYLDVPQINVYTSMKYSTSELVLKNGLGVVEKTSLPVGGPSTHCVISGHTGMATKKGLTDLTQMQLGDIFFLHVFGQDMAYQVDQIIVVEPWDNKDLAIEKDKDYVTLLTCTPYGVNDHRLLVRGIRIEYDFSAPPEEIQDVEVRISDVERTRIYIALGSAIALFLVLILATINTIIDHKKYKKKERMKNAKKTNQCADDNHDSVHNDTNPGDGQNGVGGN